MPTAFCRTLFVMFKKWKLHGWLPFFEFFLNHAATEFCFASGPATPQLLLFSLAWTPGHQQDKQPHNCFFFAFRTKSVSLIAISFSFSSENTRDTSGRSFSFLPVDGSVSGLVFLDQCHGWQHHHNKQCHNFFWVLEWGHCHSHMIVGEKDSGNASCWIAMPERKTHM